MTDKQLDALAKAMVEGKVEITEVRVNVCGKCRRGTLESDPTPNWMNRWVCDRCGHKCSQ